MSNYWGRVATSKREYKNLPVTIILWEDSGVYSAKIGERMLANEYKSEDAAYSAAVSLIEFVLSRAMESDVVS